MKSAGEIMEILEAFDLTGSSRAAAELAGCSHHTVARYVELREAGGLSGRAAPRPQLIDPFSPKVEEWVERSSSKIVAETRDGRYPHAPRCPHARLPSPAAARGSELNRRTARFVVGLQYVQREFPFEQLSRVASRSLRGPSGRRLAIAAVARGRRRALPERTTA